MFLPRNAWREAKPPGVNRVECVGHDGVAPYWPLSPRTDPPRPSRISGDLGLVWDAGAGDGAAVAGAR